MKIFVIRMKCIRLDHKARQVLKNSFWLDPNIGNLIS